MAHEDLTKDCRSLNAHLRDKAPSIVQGTIGNDVVKLIQTFAKGMYLQVEKVRPSVGIADEPDYAFCNGTIGRLGMETEDLNTNLTGKFFSEFKVSLATLNFPPKMKRPNLDQN